MEEDERTGVEREGSAGFKDFGRTAHEAFGEARIDDLYPASRRLLGEAEGDRLRPGVDQEEEALPVGRIVAELHSERAPHAVRPILDRRSRGLPERASRRP